MKALDLVLLIAISACGEAPKQSGDGNAAPAAQPAPSAPMPHPMMVTTVGSLPACAPEAEGWLVYVRSSKLLMACVSSAWTVVEVEGAGIPGEKGATGEAGAAGKDGAAGAAGKDGTDNRIIKAIYCNGALTGTSLFAVYEISILASGDLFAFGSISNLLDESGASAFYSVNQVGADTAAVIFTKDEFGSINGGWWDLSMDRGALVVTAKYNDTELAQGSTSYDMALGACTVHDF